MPETVPVRNTQSKRYSTTRPLGFRGGSIGPGGNLQPPTAGQVAGVNEAAPKVPDQPAIGQFSVDIPRPAGVGPVGAIATGVGGQVATNAAKQGIDKLFPAANKGINFNDVTSPLIGDTAKAGGGVINANTGAETFPYRGAPPVGNGTPLADTGGSAPSFDPTIGFEEGATSLQGAAFDPTIGFEEGATSLIGDAAGDVIPFAGPIINAAQGNWGGAAGGVIGSLLGGPIGGVIGGALGGSSGDCFITEAVMSAGGQGDAAPELQVLRQFRDQVMMATPIGQSMVNQYEAIAPLVVEAVSQREDAMDIFQTIKAQFIDPAVQAVQQGDNDQALRIYAQMIAFVTPFAIEAEVGPGGQAGDRVEDGQEGMDDMGSQAAMLMHSPEMANAVTGGAPDGGMMMQNDQLPGGPGQTTSPAPMLAGGPMTQGMVPNGNMPPPPGAGMGPVPQQPQPMGGTFARKRY